MSKLARIQALERAINQVKAAFDDLNKWVEDIDQRVGELESDKER